MATCTALPDFPSSTTFKPWMPTSLVSLDTAKDGEVHCESSPYKNVSLSSPPPSPQTRKRNLSFQSEESKSSKVLTTQAKKGILLSPPSHRPRKRKRYFSNRSEVSPHNKTFRVLTTPTESSSDTSSEASVLSFESPPPPPPSPKAVRYKNPKKPEVPPAVTIKNNFFKLLLRIVHSKEKLTPRKLANQLNSFDSHFSTRTKDCRDTDDVIAVLVDKTTPLDTGLLKFLDDNDRFQADIEQYESDLKSYLKVNIQDLFTGYSCFLAGKDSSMQSHHTRTIRKLKALRRQIDSTPSPQEIALTIDFLTEGTSDGEKTADLKGVSVLEEKTIEVIQSGLSFEWEGYGIKLCIPSNALPYHMEKCTITIKVSLSGQYHFPVGTELVSPVFWLSCQPSRKFQQPLSLEIQHCALPENSHNIFMVKASCTQNELPYSFEPLNGGTFNQHSSYGVIAMNSFSGVGVVQEKSEERRYWSSVFYMGPHNSRDIHFTVTWHSDAHITAIKRHYKSRKAMPGPEQSLAIKKDSITLDVPKKGIDTKDGWKLIPATPPEIDKKEVDDHNHENQTVPHCEQLAKWLKDKSQAKSLTHTVNIHGTKKEKYFVISIDPGGPDVEEVDSQPSQSKLEIRHLYNICECLKDLPRDDVIEVGLALGLHYPTLKKLQKFPEDMVEAWLLERDSVTHPPTTETLIEVLEKSGFAGTIDIVKQKFM